MFPSFNALCDKWLPYAYVDNIKIDGTEAHRRVICVIDCLTPINQEKIVRIELGFSPNLFKKLITAPMVQSIPRNIAQLMREHSKTMAMDKLSSNYSSLVEELKWANYRNDIKKKEALESEFSNLRVKIQQLHDQIIKEIFVNVSVVFNPREKNFANDIINFRPDLQMIINTKYYDKVNAWKALSQVLVLSHI